VHIVKPSASVSLPSLDGVVPDRHLQATRAQLFHELHRQPEVLVLPNVWDVGSAVLLAQVPGVRALATTSAGMAAALGIRDGERLSLDQMLVMVTLITRAVRLPISVDLEAGYGCTAWDVADSVASMIEVGAVGVNLEDGVPTDQTRLLTPQSHAKRIAAARAAAEQMGVPIVINARTDVYWRRIGPPERRFADTVRRLRLYAAAGADCVFVPGVPGPGVDPVRGRTLIGKLVRELDGTPMNLLSDSALPPIADLQALGVRRLSVGSALYRLGMATVREAVGKLLRSGRQDPLEGADRLGYRELANALPEASQR
jgi:2-methylisocitrate lyase-like PEP mutase family enzyme